MKVLSLHQPWATLIALKVKTIETRSWRATQSLIGERIAIHAAVRQPPFGLQVGPWTIVDTPGRWVASDYDRHLVHDLPLGAIVATAVLADCLPMRSSVGPPGSGDAYALLLNGLDGHMWIAPDAIDVEDQRPYGDFRPGRWAWMLADIEPLAEPVPFKGGQGLSRSWEPS